MRTDPRRPRNATPALAAIALSLSLAAACGGPPEAARTRVARVRLVTTGQPDYDAFFRAVHSMQVAVNESERDRVDLLARLGDSLDLGQGATIEAMGAAVRARVTSLPEGTLLHVGTRPPRPCQPAEGAHGEPWNTASGAFPPPQADAERAVTVDLRVDGAGAAEAESLRAGLARALRSAIALQARMDELVAFAPDVRVAGERLEARLGQALPSRAGELRPELRDAIQFLAGVGPRACAESEVAFRISVRLTASADASTAQQ